MYILYIFNQRCLLFAYNATVQQVPTQICTYICTYVYQVNIYSYSVYTSPVANFRVVCLLCLYFRTLHAYIYSPLCCDRVFSLSSVRIDKVNAFYNYWKRASAGWVCSHSVCWTLYPTVTHTHIYSETDNYTSTHAQLKSHTPSYIYNFIHIYIVSLNDSLCCYVFNVHMCVYTYVLCKSVHVCVSSDYVIGYIKHIQTYMLNINVMHKFKLLVPKLFYTLIK